MRPANERITVHNMVVAVTGLGKLKKTVVLICWLCR